MRERLIEVLQNKSCWYNGCEDDCVKCGNIGLCDSDIEKIADYLLENGVIVPPCKVGDKLYTTYCYGINDWRIEGSVVYEVRQRIGTGLEIFEMRRSKNGTFSYFKVELDKFGKTVFLTKEEAEQALSKLQASYGQVRKEDEGK